MEALDRRAGHDYVPMDLYIDPGERREHFASSPVARRLRRFHRHSARRRH
jgi:hypothetical protein